MVQFFQTAMGKRFFEGQLPELIRSINKLAENLAKASDLKTHSLNQGMGQAGSGEAEEKDYDCSTCVKSKDNEGACPNFNCSGYLDRWEDWKTNQYAKYTVETLTKRERVLSYAEWHDHEMNEVLKTDPPTWVEEAEKNSHSLKGASQ